MDIGKMTWNTDKVFLLIQTKMFILENGKIIKNKEKEHMFFLKQEWNMLVNGEMDLWKKEFGNFQMELIIKDYFKIINQKD